MKKKITKKSIWISLGVVVVILVTILFWPRSNKLEIEIEFEKVKNWESQDLINETNMLCERGEYEEAMKLCQAFLHLHPENDRKALAWHILAGIYGDEYNPKRNYRRAIRISHNIIKKYPQSDDAIIAQMEIGCCYHSLGDYKKAIKWLKKYQGRVNIIDEKYPGYESGANNQLFIGACYVQLKDYPQAIEEYQKVLDNFPDSGAVASARRQIKEIKQSMAKLEKP